MEARRHRRAVRKILGRSRGTGESEDWHAQRETENERSPSLSYPDDSSLAEVETVAWGTPAGQEDTGETNYLFFRTINLGSSGGWPHCGRIERVHNTLAPSPILRTSVSKESFDPLIGPF